MARIDKLERARQEGMSYALEVARKRGIEGLEEELPESRSESVVLL